MQALAEAPSAGTPGDRRAPLPRWVAGLVTAGLIAVAAWMFTGGAIAPWAHIFGGLGLVAILAPVLVMGLGRMDRLRLSAAGGCLLVAAGWLVWTALQLVPLPPAVVATLSPQAVALRTRLGDWDGREWICLSLAPEVGRQFLWVWSVAFVVLAASLATVRSRHLKLLAQVIAGATGVYALYGLALFAMPAASEFKPFGVPLLPGRVSGPLVNPNRFAYLMEMGLPFGLLLLREVLQEIPLPTERGRWRLWFHRLLTNRRILSRLVGWGGLCLLAAAALVLSLSRGGIAAMAAALAVSLPLMGWLERRAQAGSDRTEQWAARSVRSKRVLRRGNWISLAVLGVVFCFAVGWGFDPLFARLGNMFNERANRFRIWEASLPMVRDFWATGVGAGAYRDVFPSYQPPDLEGYARYAHNDYLNTVIDLGLPGLALLFAFLALWFRGLWRRLARLGAVGRNWRIAAAIGVLAVSLHSFGDFGLQDPTVLWYFAFILGLGLCPQQGADSREAAAVSPAEAALGAETEEPAPGGWLAQRGTRLMQGGAVAGLLTAVALGLGAIPHAAADLVRPGDLWVHLDWWRGGVQPGWTTEEIADWNQRWQRAQAYSPQDSTANYQAALAEYFLLRRELADQPLLAPSLQGPDGTIVLARRQTPLEISADQQVRLRQAREMADRAWQVGPLRPEFHLLRLRLAILADDLPAARRELPRVAALYGGVPRVLPELLVDWLYLYQRNDPGLDTATFLAVREELTRQQLSRGEGFATAVGLALNRGVTLAQVEAWMPAERKPHLELAGVLKRLDRLREAQAVFAAAAQHPEVDEADRRLRHSAWQGYLEICLRRGQVAEFETGMREYFAQMEDFEQQDMFKRHILPYVEGQAELAGEWRRILLATTEMSLLREVAAARYEVLGRLALVQGDLPTAAAELDAARERSADSSILYSAARVAMMQNKYEDAAGCYEDILQLDTGNALRVLGSLAMCYERSGQIRKAIMTYRKLAALNPDRQGDYAVKISRLIGAGGESVAP